MSCSLASAASACSASAVALTSAALRCASDADFDSLRKRTSLAAASACSARDTASFTAVSSSVSRSMLTAESEVLVIVVLADPIASTSSLAAAALAAAQPSALICDCFTLICVSFPTVSDASFSIGLSLASSDLLMILLAARFLAFLAFRSVIFFAASLAKAAAARILSSDSRKAVSFSRLALSSSLRVCACICSTLCLASTSTACTAPWTASDFSAATFARSSLRAFSTAVSMIAACWSSVAFTAASFRLSILSASALISAFFTRSFLCFASNFWVRVSSRCFVLFARDTANFRAFAFSSDELSRACFSAATEVPTSLVAISSSAAAISTARSLAALSAAARSACFLACLASCERRISSACAAFSASFAAFN